MHFEHDIALMGGHGEPSGSSAPGSGRPSSGAAAGKPRRIVLSVRPRVARTARRSHLHLTVTATDRSTRAPVKGATIRIAGRRAGTDNRGRARVTLTFSRRGRYRVRASKPGYGSATTYVRVT